MKFKVITLIIIVLYAVSCTDFRLESEVSVPEITSLFSEPETNSVTLISSLKMNPRTRIKCGFYFGEDKKTMTQYSGQMNDNEFKVTVRNLKEGTTYWYKAFVTNGINEICTNVQSFETLTTPEPPTPEPDKPGTDPAPEPEPTPDPEPDKPGTDPAPEPEPPTPEPDKPGTDPAPDPEPPTPEPDKPGTDPAPEPEPPTPEPDKPGTDPAPDPEPPTPEPDKPGTDPAPEPEPPTPEPDKPGTDPAPEPEPPTPEPDKPGTDPAPDPEPPTPEPDKPGTDPAPEPEKPTPPAEFNTEIGEITLRNSGDMVIIKAEIIGDASLIKTCMFYIGYTADKMTSCTGNIENNTMVSYFMGLPEGNYKVKASISDGFTTKETEIRTITLVGQ